MSVTGTRFITIPSSRKSSMTDMPTNTQSVSTWTDSTSGYMNNDSWSAMLPGVAASHWQKGRRVMTVGFPGKAVLDITRFARCQQKHPIEAEMRKVVVTVAALLLGITRLSVTSGAQSAAPPAQTAATQTA